MVITIQIRNNNVFFKKKELLIKCINFINKINQILSDFIKASPIKV